MTQNINERAEAAATDGTAEIETASEQTIDAGQIAQLEAEKTDLKDKLLRTLAEMENIRRRTERELADARTYGITSFARDVLSVSDNIRRALDAIPAEQRTADGPLKGFVDGIELTDRELVKTLARHGVTEISPRGEKFDPHLHQAMFEIPDASVPNGTVVQVMQTGFKIGERVLRPALVGVSKGGAKAPPALDDDTPII
ncbi:molecular chaperone GrpE [Pseudochelatococcus lubricantis]|uniref:Protein GrpE n=1 Tax=Pseudochelatococcus lubricantis TaxID=1538102 RepID=A0ABX0UY46_9HYPH|nr:nucleotide exchange factor GrpE [Pseudochelatococcus lubricantis]NIJ56799.1 molecular chaperone GrpE [Pseudochelatococcus lubricantis]